MSSSDDWKKTVRRNKLLGLWAAGKLGLADRDAEFVRTSTLRVWSNRMSRFYAS
jgi:hypothetical protein